MIYMITDLFTYVYTSEFPEEFEISIMNTTMTETRRVVSFPINLPDKLNYRNIN